MNIDIERLKRDRAYWDECKAPEWATCIGLVGMSGLKIWHNLESYQYAEGDQIGKVFKFSDGVTYNHNEVKGSFPRPEPATEWDGDYPPAGTVCEVSNAGKQYEWCKIRFMGETLCVVDHAEYVEQYYHLRSVTFRPIRTKAEREREELVELLCDHRTKTAGECADAILAADWQKPE